MVHGRDERRGGQIVRELADTGRRAVFLGADLAVGRHRASCCGGAEGGSTGRRRIGLATTSSTLWREFASFKTWCPLDPAVPIEDTIGAIAGTRYPAAHMTALDSEKR